MTGSQKARTIATAGLAMPVLWLLGLALLLVLNRHANTSIPDLTLFILLLAPPVLGVLLSACGMALALKATDARKEYWHSSIGVALNGLLLSWIYALGYVH